MLLLTYDNDKRSGILSIKYAILGLLSWKPSTGYELKKVFEESSVMYWSGNNNQIYKALVELTDEDLATSELLHQEGSPSKKVYTITEQGLAELKDWVLSKPEAPDFKKTFLVQLAWADKLSGEELNGLLSRYENEVKMQLIQQQEKIRRGVESPCRSPKETFLWNMISDNLLSSYRNELEWINRMRDGLMEKGLIEVKKKMNYNVIERENKKYVEFFSSEKEKEPVRNVLELIYLCGEQDTDLLMVHATALPEEFFNLKSGVAGDMLQKFANYRMKVVVVLTGMKIKGKFRELVNESNRGSQFGVFDGKQEAEAWLLKE